MTERGSLEADKLKRFMTHVAGISPQGRGVPKAMTSARALLITEYS